MLYLLIAVSGLLNAIQAGCNSTLQRSLQHPVISAIVSFASGTIMLLVALGAYSVLTRAPMPGTGQWTAIPWWGWIGGSLGAIYILTMVLTAQKAGSGVFVGVSVTASLVASVVIDHFGLLGFQQHSAGPARLLGGALMIAGTILIGKF